MSLDIEVLLEVDSEFFSMLIIGNSSGRKYTVNVFSYVLIFSVHDLKFPRIHFLLCQDQLNTFLISL